MLKAPLMKNWKLSSRLTESRGAPREVSCPRVLRDQGWSPSVMPSHTHTCLPTASSRAFSDCVQGTQATGPWELPGVPHSDPSPHRGGLSTHHVFGIWLHGYGPIDFFPPPDSEVIFQVEDSLLPVGVGGVRGCGRRKSETGLRGDVSEGWKWEPA